MFLGALAPIIALGETPGERAVDALPHYRPEEHVSGVIRLWGHGSPRIDFMGPLVRRREAGFMSFQPGITFDYRMYGTVSAIGALCGRAGNLAIMGPPVHYYEKTAYERVMRYPPVEGAEIATDLRKIQFVLRLA
jgi:phosphate transport system substrate-binding protein